MKLRPQDSGWLFLNKCQETESLCPYTVLWPSVDISHNQNIWGDYYVSRSDINLYY